MRLTWTAPASAGASAIDSYGYQRSSDGGRTWRGGYAGGASARSVVISGLTNGVTYQYRLAAHNSVGWGVLSNIISVTPRVMAPSAPALAASVVGSGQIRLTWTTPTFTGGASIDSYGYQRSSDGGRTWRGGYAGGASARSVVISGLTNGVTYQYRLAAHNSVGWGVLSNIISVTPRVMAPSAPALAASVVGSGQIRLTWTTPTFTGGASIDSYGYQRSSDGGRTWHGGYAGGASARSVVISGLTNGVTYQYRLAAHNSVGWGALSNIISVTPAASLAATLQAPEVSVDSDPPTSEPTSSESATSGPPTSQPEATAPTTVATTEAPEPSAPVASSPAEPDSSVGDLVWVDVDLDGVQDVGEPGLGGVVVRLIGAGGTVVDEEVSDSQGHYELVPTSSGSLSLEVVLPDGYEPTLVDVGLDDAIDSDVDPVDVVVGPVETTVRVALDDAGSDFDLDVGLVAVSEEPSPDSSVAAEPTTILTTETPTTTQTSTSVPTTETPTTTETTTTSVPATETPTTATTTRRLGADGPADHGATHDRYTTRTDHGTRTDEHRRGLKVISRVQVPSTSDSPSSSELRGAASELSRSAAAGRSGQLTARPASS